jgi:hypothetical protein
MAFITNRLVSSSKGSRRSARCQAIPGWRTRDERGRFKWIEARESHAKRDR